MRVIKHTHAATWFTLLLLLLSICFGLGMDDKARAQPDHSISKISPDLLKQAGKARTGARLSVIVQFDNTPGRLLDSILSGYGASVLHRFKNLNSLHLSLPAAAIEPLALRNEVKFISADRQIESFGHITSTTGADAIRTQTVTTTQTLLLGITTTTTTTTTLDGSGIGIAIIDSGIDINHSSFKNNLSSSRVVVSQDFTGEGRTDDPYGHGTHVASAAAGSGQSSNNMYVGIAPNANILNLRVLNSQGAGSTSSLLSALDWVLSNRSLYNIRVVNLSLGSPAVETFRQDPLCQAVRRLVDAGVVVVAAAGNNGKNSSGQKVYGQIHSPGIEPSAVTVGASNSYGTDSRVDDVVASYSSRGPTRSGWTDATGLKHFDNLIKPDLVAPGNKVIWAEAVDNFLVTQHPELDANASLLPGRKMMYLSGSSMATPVVAGAAALMLQANPALTPNLVKALLMYTAQPLSGYNLFEQGAGEVNIEGAVRLGQLVRRDLAGATPLGDPLLTTTSPPTPWTTIAGQTFDWSQGMVLNHTYITGTDLVTKYQKIYAMGLLLGDGMTEDGSSQVVNPMMMTGGVVPGSDILTCDGTTLNSGTIFFATSSLLSDGVLIDDGIIIGDGVIVGDGIIIGDGIINGDSYVQAQSAMFAGDNTSYMR